MDSMTKMTTTREASPPNEELADRKSGAEDVQSDVCAALIELGKSCRSGEKYYREALQFVANHFGSPYSAIRVTHATSTIEEHVRSETDDVAAWESEAEYVLLESQVKHTPIARMYEVQGTPVKVAVLAIPICEPDGGLVGAMSVIVRCESLKIAKLYLGEFSAIVSLIASTAWQISMPSSPGGTQNTKNDQAVERAVVKASDFKSLHELGFAITNSMKNKFSCEQVVLSYVKGSKLQIISISGLDDVYPNSPGVKKIHSAMEECYDFADVICSQIEDDWTETSVTSNHCLHRAWHIENGSAPVASVPLMVGDNCIGILSFTRAKKFPFTQVELSKIVETVSPFAPAMMLVAKAERGLWNHMTDSAKKGASWFFAPRSYQRKLVAALLLAGMAYFCLAKTDYQVTTTSQITPSDVQVFAAPFEGTIGDCHVEDGQTVERGDLLYEMDTTDLQLEMDRLESELEVLRLRVNQALVIRDVRAASLAGAEIQVVTAKQDITKHNLSHAQVRATSRGTIVAGKLSQRIGEIVPLGAPLMDFVPEGDWSIELVASEGVATDLQVGLKGEFACNARPGEMLHCKIVRLRPSFEPRDGKNVFIAEAIVQDNPEWMRPGMEGVARLDVGQRRVWWVTLHRAIDYIHLNFWL